MSPIVKQYEDKINSTFFFCFLYVDLISFLYYTDIKLFCPVPISNIFFRFCIKRQHDWEVSYEIKKGVL